jgi:hypothetical protein
VRVARERVKIQQARELDRQKRLVHGASFEPSPVVTTLHLIHLRSIKTCNAKGSSDWSRASDPLRFRSVLPSLPTNRYSVC